MTAPEIELIEDEEGMGVVLRGGALTAYTEAAARRGVTVEALLDRVLCDALGEGRL